MRTSRHILIVEDDRDIAALVERFLQEAGFRTTHLVDGRAVEAEIQRDRPDLILLDLLLPGEDGRSIARRVRQKHTIPIIMLTAMGEERSRVAGLNLGADDYVSKPFSARELIARMNAVLRRTVAQDGNRKLNGAVYGFEGWHIDTRGRELFSPDGLRIILTSAEFDLLQILVENRGTVLGRDHLMLMAQGRRVEPYSRGIDTLISRLRQKIEPDPAEPRFIKTIRHEGYVFVPEIAVVVA